MTRWISLTASLLACAAAHAHHSQAGLFDPNETVEVTGTVKSVSWQNPHGHIVFTVVDAGGKAVDWDAETASVSVLRIRGIDTVQLKPGDKISVAGSPSRRGQPELLAKSMLLPSGYEFTFGGQTPYFPAGKAGKLFSKGVIDADVAKARAAADGLFRVWSTIMSDPAAFPMFKGGYPINAAAKAKIAQWNPRDNPLLKCGTKGQPLIMISPLPMEFVKQDNGDILLKIEEYDVRRMIHMAPNTVAPAEHTQFGFSRGRWEGNTLVVVTDHIREQPFEPDGVPQSEQMTTVERFMPTATYDRLDYRITVTDPTYFEKPFDLTRYFVWKPENTVHPYECSERY
ncbi:MAG TPA: DUF6152 family protein [Gammaproteobacteria bacterium]|nr:DUF6152 family protein [Gammaproteobacteria bacterium]